MITIAHGWKFVLHKWPTGELCRYGGGIIKFGFLRELSLINVCHALNNHLLEEDFNVNCNMRTRTGEISLVVVIQLSQEFDGPPRSMTCLGYPLTLHDFLSFS